MSQTLEDGPSIGSSKRSKWRRLCGLGAIVAAAHCVAALVGAFTADKWFAETVQLVLPAAPEVVKLEKELWEPGQPVAAIYGTPVGEPLRVVMPAANRVRRPPEDPALTLMFVDKQQGENPLQVKTVWFLAIRAALAMAAMAGLFAVLWRYLRPHHE